MKQQIDYSVYAVTDRGDLSIEDFLQAVEEALHGGITILQLREKTMQAAEKEGLAMRVLELCRTFSVPCLINDDVELAQKIGADGVHLGQTDMPPAKARQILGPGAIIGVTAKTVTQAQQAEAAGADYLGSGALFVSQTKGDALPLTRQQLIKIVHSTSLPVVAIGGLQADNLEILSGTGVAGAAICGGIFRAPRICHETQKIKELMAGIVTGGKAIKMERQTQEETKNDSRTQARVVLSIAGSDSSGGAGIQADLKTIQAMGGYGMTAITALTAQNTTGVQAIFPVTEEFLRQQLDSVLTDIPPQAVKIGMVAVPELIRCIAENLRLAGVKNIVVDPVMVATSGSRLLEPEAVSTLCQDLLPLASVITPNIPETEVLTGVVIRTAAEMEAAAKQLYERFGCAVLCKGGHRIEDANDVLVSEAGVRWFKGERINNPNTHGTGCTLSSAIATALALGADLEQAVASAKLYLEDCLRAGLDLGEGSGPLDHRAGWRA